MSGPGRAGPGGAGGGSRGAGGAGKPEACWVQRGAPLPAMLGGLRAVGSRSRAAAPRSSGPRFCIVPAGSDSVTHGGSGGRWGPCYVPSKHMPQRRQDRGHWDLTANPWKVCQPLPPTPPGPFAPHIMTTGWEGCGLAPNSLGFCNWGGKAPKGDKISQENCKHIYKENLETIREEMLRGGGNGENL